MGPHPTARVRHRATAPPTKNCGHTHTRTRTHTHTHTHTETWATSSSRRPWGGRLERVATVLCSREATSSTCGLEGKLSPCRLKWFKSGCGTRTRRKLLLSCSQKIRSPRSWFRLANSRKTWSSHPRLTRRESLPRTSTSAALVTVLKTGPTLCTRPSSTRQQVRVRSRPGRFRLRPLL